MLKQSALTVTTVSGCAILYIAGSFVVTLEGAVISTGGTPASKVVNGVMVY